MQGRYFSKNFDFNHTELCHRLSYNFTTALLKPDSLSLSNYIQTRANYQDYGATELALSGQEYLALFTVVQMAPSVWIFNTDAHTMQCFTSQIIINHCLYFFQIFMLHCSALPLLVLRSHGQGYGLLLWLPIIKTIHMAHESIYSRMLLRFLSRGDQFQMHTVTITMSTCCNDRCPSLYCVHMPTHY